MNPADFGKVAVLMGGWSAEREISLLSGRAVLEALQRAGVDAHGVDAGRDVIGELQQGRYQRAFIVLHGRGGEDGVIQGALELIGLPYTGSGVMGSAIAMDKLVTKRLWRGAGMPTPDYQVLNRDADWSAVTSGLGMPLIVKPALEGSSIGMTRVESLDDLPAAYEQAATCGGAVFAERWVAGDEFTAAILGDEVLPLIRLETPRAFYDFEAKYKSDTTRYHCPSELDDAVEQRLRALAKQAFDAVGASGWGRVDLMLDRVGVAWLIEVNTVPGMTDHSLVPMAAKAAGIDFEELVLRILAQTLDHGERQ
ncbi:D-alanine--D-alanine ligase [Thioalkalivibrio denitrificans]|uniref:D-alanine--D-alanine ligase n=1 Tax=Thioalkalivibrio denitrificans TaxID=108003 RepID=A0A1V3NN62_9GAMM|nr:D-alanine--D-alanine ligase [Thioalkalivibrio denitrificans]OOG26454.1 D-alanine--D-alanine ligase [Thioalkalivibrio denitrificans]